LYPESNSSASVLESAAMTQFPLMYGRGMRGHRSINLHPDFARMLQTHKGDALRATMRMTIRTIAVQKYK
jgi:hypothetical protein